MRRCLRFGRVTASAPRDVRDSGRAGNLLEVDRWVVSSLEPIEAPLAAFHERGWKLVALVTVTDTSVLSTAIPATELSRAAVGEPSKSTTGHHNIEVVVSEVTSSVGSLNDHLLARNRSTGEAELVALATPRTLISSGNVNGREPVRGVVVDGPGGHVCASEGISSIATGYGVGVRQESALPVAGPDGAGNVGLPTPRTTRLAAIPVTRRFARTRLGRDGGDKERQEVELVHHCGD